MSWTADSREIVFTSNQNLWRVSISNGAPQRLVVGGENAGDPSLSLQHHRLAYLQTTNNTNIWRIEIANQTLPAPLISSTQENHFPHYSPDGKKIAFASNRSGSLEIWVCDRDGQNPVQLTFFGSGVTAAPRWSPDGRHLVFASQATGEVTTYIISANGGKPRRLKTSIPEQVFPSWSRWARIYFFPTHGTYQVWKIPVRGQSRTVTKQEDCSVRVLTANLSYFKNEVFGSSRCRR
jgi:Tol biopolymer transport system component